MARLNASRKQPDHVIGKELAVQDQQRLLLAFFLVEQLTELVQQLGQVGTEALAPVVYSGIGRGEQAHEDVRAADAVPAGGAGHP